MIGLFHTCLLAVFLGFAALVGYRLLTGAINLQGLAAHGPGEAMAVDRVQAVAASVGAAGAYLWIAVADMAASAGPLTALPDVPNWLMTVVGASQAVYLGGKLAASPRRGE